MRRHFIWNIASDFKCLKMTVTTCRLWLTFTQCSLSLLREWSTVMNIKSIVSKKTRHYITIPFDINTYALSSVLGKIRRQWQTFGLFCDRNVKIWTLEIKHWDTELTVCEMWRKSWSFFGWQKCSILRSNQYVYYDLVGQMPFLFISRHIFFLGIFFLILCRLA